MEFRPDDEQSLLLAALEGVIGRREEPQRCSQRFLTDPGLEARLLDGGFFSLAANGYGPLEATLVTIALCRLPVCVEAAASLLIAPLLPDTAARPIALASGRLSALAGTAVRFLSGEGSLVVADGAEVHLIELRAGDVRRCHTHYAYPYGAPSREALSRARPIDVDPADLLRCRRIALAAEMAGAAEAALERTVRQVKERYQFGRPIGSFQAVQHRLAMGATRVESCRWLALRAASTGAAVDAALAAAYAQDMAPQLTFDLHQFSGAMGLTLEYPLHLWTYRMRALQGELHGAQSQAAAAAELTWASARAS